MDELVIEHKDLLKNGVWYLLVVAVLAAVFIAAGDQFVMSAGTVILIVALVIEIYTTVSTFISAYSKEILTPEGVTTVNVFGKKTYLWKDLERFEVLWDYKGKRLIKKEEIDAPYILLKFTVPRKTIRFDYLEAIDQYIRSAYGQPHKDNWTNIK